MVQFIILYLIPKKMTVKELFAFCSLQIKKGNGDKHIFISSDDEWNEFHELFYSFTDDKQEIEEAIRCSNTDKYDIERYHKLEDIVLLG